VDDGYLDVEHLVLLVLLAPIVGLGLAVVVPKIWRMKADRPPPKPRRWTLRRALWSSWVRTLPLNFVQLLFLELAMIAGFFEKLLSGAGGHVAGEVTLAFGWTFIALLLVWPIVMLFNRPKVAVPPAMRNERGALELWWRSRNGPIAQVRERDRP
jgi:hypothetical protein